MCSAVAVVLINGEAFVAHPTSGELLTLAQLLHYAYTAHGRTDWLASGCSIQALLLYIAALRDVSKNIACAQALMHAMAQPGCPRALREAAAIARRGGARDTARELEHEARSLDRSLAARLN